MKVYHCFLLVALLVLLLLPMNADAACIDLGTAADFALLGGSGVTNAVPGTVVIGDVGSSPTPAVTGFPPGVVVGTLYTTPNAVTAQAQVDLATAYNSAAGQACDADLTGTDLGGLTLVPGVYCFSSSAFLTGTLTLDAQGDPNACWVFQIGTTLITATGSNVLLINGASPCNVFWQIGTSATIGVGSDFAGNIMALASITLDGGTLQGRALARNGAVTISGSQFVNSICIPSHPCVSITKAANRVAAAVGDTITYTFTVCNCGPTPITVDSVSDTLLGSLTTAFTTANGGATIPVGECAAFTVDHPVTVGDPDPIVNSVTVTVHDDTGSTSDTDTETVDKTDTTPTNCLTVVKTADRILASPGDLVTYTFTVCNCGTSALTVDSVTDTLLGNLTAAFTTANGGATLAGGACAMFTATRTVLGTDPNPLDNTVTVNAHSNGTPVTDSDSWSIAIIPGPCVSIAKVADRATASVGDTITYTFTVCNCGTPPVTVTSVVDSHLGNLTAAFLTANGGSPIIPFGECVVFTASRVVLPSDPPVLTNSVTVTAQVGAEVITDTDETSVVIGPRIIYQAVPSDSGGANTAFQGYLGPGADVNSSIAGVFSIVPGVNWANFVSAAQMGVPYTLKNVTLCKTHPEIIQCADVFPADTICQQGTPNIRLWWPLMYEIPGTTWTLTIVYGTGTLFDDDGPTGPHPPSYVHTETWSWQVGATVASLKQLLELFHELPFALDEVPMVSDEALYPILQAKLDALQVAIDEEEFVTAGLILGDFEMEVMDACIAESPARPNPTGNGTGIANSLENPACCKLLADAEYLGFSLGILQPAK